MEKLLREAVDAIKGLKQNTQLTIKRVTGWFLLHGHDASGAEVPLLSATDGRLYVSGSGVDASGATTTFLTATDGSQYVLLAGHDASGNIQEILTATDGTLQVSTEGTTTKTVVDAVAIPAVEADVWDPGTDATEYFDIELEITPIDISNDATGVSVGVDYGDTGSTDHYYVRGITVTAAEVGIRIGPYRIGGDDTIRAVCANADDASLHIFIKEEGTAV